MFSSDSAAVRIRMISVICRVNCNNKYNDKQKVLLFASVLFIFYNFDNVLSPIFCVLCVFLRRSLTVTPSVHLHGWFGRGCKFNKPVLKLYKSYSNDKLT